MISIETDGRGVTDDDRHRAEAAALKVLADAGVTVRDAYGEFRRQWDWLETDEATDQGMSQDYSNLTGAAALWAQAERAADIALTEGWHDPNGAHCWISA